MATRKDIVLQISFRDDGSAKIKKITTSVKKQLKSTGAAAKRMGKDFKSMTDHVKGSFAAQGKFKKMLKSTWAQMAMGMGVMTGVTMAMRSIKKAITSVISTGREFEAEWANVTTMISDASVNTEEMKNQLIGLSPVLGSTTELAKGMYQILSASVEPAKAIMFLGEAAKSAQAGVTDVFTAVDALTTVINAYGMEAEDVTRVSDVMFQTVMRGKLTYEGLASTLGTIVPIASKVGVGLAEVSAAMSTLTRQGVDVNTTVVQLRQIMVSVLKPKKQAAEMAKKLGLEFNSAALRAKGLSKFLADVQEKTKGNVDQVTMLFGNVRALTGVFGLAGEGAAGFAKDLVLANKAMEEGGQTEIAFGKQMKSLDFWIKAIKNSLEKLKISIWQGFSEPLKKGIETSGDFEERINKMSTDMIKFGQDIGKAVGNAVAFIIKFRDTIVTVTKVMVLFWAVNKMNAWSMAFRVTMLTGASSAGMFGGAMKLAAKATRLLNKAFLPLAVLFAAFKLTKVIAEFTGLNNVIKNLMQKAPGVTQAHMDETTAMTALKEEVRGTGASIIQLKGKYGSWAKALDAVRNAQEPAITQQKEINDELKNSQKLIDEMGLKMRTDLVVEWMDYGAVLDDANLKQKFTTKQIGTMAKKFVSLSDELGYKLSPAMRKLAEDTKTVENAFKKTIPEMSKIAATTDQIEDAIKSYVERGGDAVEVTKLFEGDIRKLAKEAEIASKVFGVPFPAGLKKLVEGLDEAVPKARDLGDILKSASDQAMLSAQAASVLGVTLQSDLVKKVEETEQAFTNLYAQGELGPKEVVKGVKNLINAFKAAGQKVPEAYEKILAENVKLVKEMEKGTNKMKLNWIDSLGEMATAFNLLGDEIGGMGGALVSTLGTALGQVGQKMKDLGAEGKITGGEILTAIGPQLAGDIGASLGGIISGAKKNFGALGSTVGGAMGSIFGPVGKVIGSAFGGLIGGLFKKGLDEAEKAAAEADRLARQLEDQTKEATKAMSQFGKISDSTAEAIAESRKEMEGFAAESYNFAAVIDDVGVTQSNVNNLWKRSTDILHQMNSGFLTVEQGAKAAGESFIAMVEGAKALGEEGSAAMTEFIKQVKASGVEVAEVTDYINDQLGTVKASSMNAAQGLEAMAAAVGVGFDELKQKQEDLTASLEGAEKGTEAYKKLQDEIKQTEVQMAALGASSTEEMARLERQTLATFNAMMANGATTAEAMESLGGTFDIIAEKNEAMGLTSSVAIQELLKIREVVAANQELFTAVEGNLAVLNALANTGSLTQEVLMDSAVATSEYYKQLTDAGLSGNQALAQMAPTLERLRYLSQEHGLALDDATQKLIKQAEEQSLLDEQQLSTQDAMMAGFGLIIQALGKDIPDAMKKSIEKMHELEKSAKGSGVYTAMEEVKNISMDTFSSMDSSIAVLVGNFGGMEEAIVAAKAQVGAMGADFDSTFASMTSGIFSAIEGVGELEGRIKRGDFSIRGSVDIDTSPGGIGVGPGRKSTSAQGGYDDIIREPVKPFVAHRGERVTVTKASDVRKGASGMGGVESLLQQLITAVKEGGNVELVPTLVPVGEHLDKWIIKASPRLSKAGALRIHPKGVTE